MKKVIEYVIKAIGFFAFITILDYIFKFDIDIKSNICFAIGYFIFDILIDNVFKKNNKKEE